MQTREITLVALKKRKEESLIYPIKVVPFLFIYIYLFIYINIYNANIYNINNAGCDATIQRIKKKGVPFFVVVCFLIFNNKDGMGQ